MSSELAPVAIDHRSLKRVTTELNEIEDRMQLSGELDSGEQVVFWLTRRMLKRLVPHLLAWLEPSSTPGKPASNVPDYHNEALQGFAQQAAVAQIASQPPVRAESLSQRWLVEAVDIARGPETLMLIFKGADQVASLPMAQAFLRQWLSIIYKQCQRAEWDLDIWPQWISDGTASAQVRSGTTMH